MRRHKNKNIEQNNQNFVYQQPAAQQYPQQGYTQQPNQYMIDPMMQQQMYHQQMMQQQMYHQQMMQQQFAQQQTMMQQQLNQQPIQSQQENVQSQKPANFETLKGLKLFKNERNWLIVKIILWTLVLLASIGTTAFFGYCSTNQETANLIPRFTPYYLIPLGILDLVILVFWCLTISKINHWNRIIKSIQFNSQERLSSTNFLKGFFKSSIKWNISINWLCGYTYFLWLVAILFAFCSSYFTAIYVFGGKAAPDFGTIDWSTLIPPNDIPFTSAELVFARLPYYTLVFGAVIVGFMIVVQIINIVVFNFRKKALNTFYGDLFTYETYSAIVGKTNKVNFIIYSVLTLIFILTLVLFIIFSKKLLQKNK